MSQYQDWMPEHLIAGLWGKVPPQSKWAFLATLVAGLMTHLYMFVNKFPNGDDLASVYHNFNMITSGRWFDKPAMALSSYYSMPWVTGLVALFFMALSVVLLVRILDLRRKTTVVLTACLVATFAPLASYFSYLFYSDLYMIALFLGLLSVWLARNLTWGWLPGGLALACSLGCYQAFVGVPVVVCLLSLMVMSLEEERPLKTILVQAGRYLLLGLLGVGLYFLILKGLLAWLGLELVDYQGIDAMGRITLAQFKGLLPKAYQGFWAYFAQGPYFDSPKGMKLTYLLLGLIGLAGLVLTLGRRRQPKGGQTALLAVLLLLLPPAFNLVYFMAPDAYLHSLMQPQYMLAFVIPLTLWERALAPGSGRPLKVLPWQVAASWILILGTGAVAYHGFLTTNIAYLHLDLKYEITYATQLRILDRIEQHPDYTRETPVLFLGYFPTESQSMFPPDTKNAVRGLVGVNGNLVHHYHNYKGFYRNYLGVELTFADEIQRQEILAYLENQPMPVWPKAGSVDMVEGVMVVQLSRDNQGAMKIWN